MATAKGKSKTGNISKKGVINKKSTKVYFDKEQFELNQTAAKSFDNSSIKYHNLNECTFTDCLGKTTVIRTYGKHNSTIQLLLDPSNHPAWNKAKFASTPTGQGTKFKNKFGTL